MLGLCGCGASTTPQQSPADTPVADFSGHWEVDYARSDSVQTQLNSTFRDIQRQARRQRDAAERGMTVQGPPLGDVDTVLALAKMAELVTASDLLVVDQDIAFVRIDRENSFALVCDIRGGSDSHHAIGARDLLVGWSAITFFHRVARGFVDTAPIRPLGRWRTPRPTNTAQCSWDTAGF
jgi:hypothetical protein